MRVYLCVCVRVRLCLPKLCPYIYMHLSIYIYIYIYIYMSVRPSVRPSVRLSVCLCVAVFPCPLAPIIKSHPNPIWATHQRTYQSSGLRQEICLLNRYITSTLTISLRLQMGIYYGLYRWGILLDRTRNIRVQIPASRCPDGRRGGGCFRSLYPSFGRITFRESLSGLIFACAATWL